MYISYQNLVIRSDEDPYNLDIIRLKNYYEFELTEDGTTHKAGGEIIDLVISDYASADNTYFDKINKCLVSKGKAILQIITISEDIFLQYQNRVDFIQKHIFPGGVLPTKNIIRNLAKKYNFTIVSETAFGLDYAKTLQIWLDNFNKQLNLVLHSGFDMQFVRKWQFYLSYCYAGFIANRTDVVQFELQKNY